ncbi:MAG: DUF3299 domain-containing protein [Pseudomonadota bacterium]
MIRRLILAAVMVFLGGIAALAKADDFKLINWDDLIPDAPQIVNPFDALEPETQEDLSYVIRTRLDLRMDFIDEDSEEVLKSAEIEAKLTEQGVDVDEFEQNLIALEQEIIRRGAMVSTELEGRIVRMPGYALPLELNEDGVSEFLLVPYVGACIHVPPPPPNQMVYVTLSEPYQMTSLYDPVWITGPIRAEASSRMLTFVDGTAPVETGYAIDSLRIEPYE